MPASEEVISELRTALTHLDDPPYLERHLLTRRLSFIAEAPDLSRGQLLRRTLRLAIEALDPGANTARSAAAARSYEVLHRYAIAKQSVVAIAARLDISERQAYRELQRAVEAVAQILGELAAEPSCAPTQPSAGVPARAAKVREEVERLVKATDQEVDLAQLLESAAASAGPLARERQVEISLQPEVPSLKVNANRVMLRQAVLNLLSHMVTARQGGQVVIRLQRGGGLALLEFAYRPHDKTALLQSDSPYAVAAQLFDSLGLDWQRMEAADGAARIIVHIPIAQERTLLIVDDNEGLIALFRRYLRHQPYRVLAAHTAAEALATLDREHPDVIVLDVMMPDRDGWEVLQEIRASTAGARARIIVCSIINDPQLSAALGAHGFLHKPVDQASLQQALADVMRDE